VIDAPRREALAVVAAVARLSAGFAPTGRPAAFLFEVIGAGRPGGIAGVLLELLLKLAHLLME
jgi:hypothetical protein